VKKIKMFGADMMGKAPKIKLPKTKAPKVPKTPKIPKIKKVPKVKAPKVNMLGGM